MNEKVIIDIVRDALYIIIRSAAPMLLISLIVGLVVSMLQTVTSIQEQTLTFVPKLIAIFLVLVICGNWILTSLTEYTVNLFSNFDYFISNL